MFGLGTIINTVLVILGGLLGLLFKKGISERYEKTLMAACGVSTIFIGVTGTLQGMLTVVDGNIETQGTMLLIFSFVLGGLFGELINIEKRMDVLGEKLKKIFHAEKDNKFVDGFAAHDGFAHGIFSIYNHKFPFSSAVCARNSTRSTSPFAHSQPTRHSKLVAFL